MKKIIFSIFVLSFLFLLSTIFPVQAGENKNNPPTSPFAQEGDSSPLLRGVRGVSPTLEKGVYPPLAAPKATRVEGGFEQGTFTLKIKDNLINLQAE